MTDPMIQALDDSAAPARPEFRDEVRAAMSDAWHGTFRISAEPVGAAPSCADRQPGTMVWIASAAAVLVGVIGVAIAVNGSSPRIVGTTPTVEPGTADTDPTSSASTPTSAPVEIVPTSASPSPVAPTTSAPAEVDSSAAAVAAWLAEQLTDGRSSTYVLDGDGTTARLFASRSGDGSIVTTVRLDDGRLIDVPADLMASGTLDVRLTAVDSRPALVARMSGAVRLWVLDESAGAFVAGPDLRIGDRSDQGSLNVASVDGSLVVTVVAGAADATGMWVPVDQRGAVVSPDLVVSSMAMPPSPVPAIWTNVSGSHLLLMGLDTAAGGEEPLHQPWSYDVVTDEWRAVPNPDWLDCGADGLSCSWGNVHEGGDPFLAASTPGGVVVRTPSGSVGLLDPAAKTWRRLDDAPFVLAQPSTVVLHDGTLVVLPVDPYDQSHEFGRVGFLDTETGAWTTKQIDVSTVSGRRWAVVTDANTVLVGVIDQSFGGTLVAVLDRTSGAVRPSGSADSIRWNRLQGGDTATFFAAWQTVLPG